MIQEDSVKVFFSFMVGGWSRVVYVKWLKQVRTERSCGLLDVVKISWFLLAVCLNKACFRIFREVLSFSATSAPVLSRSWTEVNTSQQGSDDSVCPFFVRATRRESTAGRRAVHPPRWPFSPLKRRQQWKSTASPPRASWCRCMAFKINQGNVKGPRQFEFGRCT